MLHLLCHGTSVDNGHLRGPLTLTPIAEHLAVELSLPFYDLGLSRLRFEHSTLSFIDLNNYLVIITHHLIILQSVLIQKQPVPIFKVLEVRIV